MLHLTPNFDCAVGMQSPLSTTPPPSPRPHSTPSRPASKAHILFSSLCCILQVVDPFALEASALQAARELADKKLKPKGRKIGTDVPLCAFLRAFVPRVLGCGSPCASMRQ